MNKPFPFEHFLKGNDKNPTSSPSSPPAPPVEETLTPPQNSSYDYEEDHEDSSANMPVGPSLPKQISLNFDENPLDDHQKISGSPLSYFFKDSRPTENENEKQKCDAEKIDQDSFTLPKQSEIHHSIEQNQRKDQTQGQSHASNASNENLLREILHLIKESIGPQKYKAFFQNNFSLLRIAEEQVFFGVTTPFIKTMIETHYKAPIIEAVKSILGPSYQVVLEEHHLTTSTLRGGHEQNILNILKQETTKTPPNPPGAIKVAPQPNDLKFKIDLMPSKKDRLYEVDSKVLSHMGPDPYGIKLDYNKTFDKFIVGPSNHMAYATALAVTKSPGKTYPSVCLYGDSGLGKTHILHAVGNKIKNDFPSLRLCITTGRDFMNEMVNALANKKISDFRKKYSDKIDVLMIDDVHELKNKHGTQNELFHVFNELHNKGKQLIFTTDKSPQEIDGLADRLKTRLSWGLVVDIQCPDLETRIAILKRKAKEEDIFVSEDVVNLIAQISNKNIRELEGALIRLGAYSSVFNVDIDMEIAKEQLNLKDKFQTTPTINIESLAKSVSGRMNITLADIKSKSRNKNVAYCRHIAMYLSYELLGLTFSEIGSFFGNRNHTSVLHAVEKIKKSLETDGHLRDLVADLRRANS